MGKLEDHWARIQESDSYNTGDDTFRESVRQRFFERTVGASEVYKSALPDVQQKIMTRFNERLNPSKMPQVIEAVKEGAVAGAKAAKTTIESPMPLEEESRRLMGAAKRAIVSPLERTSNKFRAGAIRRGMQTGSEDEADPLNKNVHAAIDIGVSAVTGTAAKIADFGLPGSLAEAGGMMAVGGALEMAGKTTAGKFAKAALTTDVGKGYTESMLAKFRRLKNLPPVRLNDPLKHLIEEEKTNDLNYKMAANDPLYMPYNPEIRGDITKLRAAHQEKLMNMRAQEPPLKGQVQAEEDVAYQKKLESMPPVERMQNQKSLIPFKSMLEFGQEGKLRGSPTAKPNVGDIVTPEVMHTLENMAAEGKPKDPFLQDMWKDLGEKGEVSLGKQVDPDVKKFGAERNLMDITYKPLRNLLKEINDDLGHLGFARFGPSNEDPVVLEAAKDLRVAVKLGRTGKYSIEKFGADAHSMLPSTGPEYGQEEGFWDEITKKFFSREEAAKMLGWSDQRIKSSGGLMAQNLRDLHENWKKLGNKGQIRIGAGGRKPVKAVGQDDYEVLNQAKDLRVAVRLPTGKVEVGNYGDTHASAFSDLIKDEVMDQSEFGFYNNKTKAFMSREEAANWIGQPRNPLMAQQLGDLHRAGTTYLGKQEEGLHSDDLRKVKETASIHLVKQINKEVGEKGHVWSDADPERWDRIKQNVRELLRRANRVGYDATNEVIAYADRNYVGKEELHFLKNELKAEEPDIFDPRPLSEFLQATKGGKDAKNTLWEKVKDRWTPDGTASKVKTLLTKRYGELAEGHLDSQYFIHNTLKGLTKTEREAMSFKGVAPAADRFKWPNAKEILDLIRKPSESMKKADKALTDYMNEAHNFLSENFDDVGYWKNYVTLIIDKPTDEMLRPAGSQLGTFNPFIQKRTLPNYAAVFNRGGTPKTLDIASITSIYDKYKIKTVANVRFFEELSKFPTPQGLPAVMDAKLAPMGWIKTNDVPALVGKRVHPDYLQAIKVVTDAPFSNKALRAYDTISALQRYAFLTLDPFHFGSLFFVSSLSSDIPFKIPLKVIAASGKYIMKEALADKSQASFWSKVFKAYSEGHAAFIDLPASKRAVRAGLNIGNVGEEYIGQFEKMLINMESRMNKFYLSKGIKPIRGVVEVFNKPLWDYFHAGIKLMTFQEHLISNMKKFPEIPIAEIERKTASYVNDLDGGVAWETLFVSPQYQKALHRAFFFPDWMTTRLRTLSSVLKPVGLDTMKHATSQTPESYQAKKYWLRVGLLYYTFANWRNYSNTKRDGIPGRDGKPGRFMWDNDPGKELDVYSNKDEKGRSIYSNYSPAITEVFKWFMHPARSLGARFNQNLQLMSEFFTGFTLSGYKIPENERTFTGFLKRKGPMSLKGNNEYFLFPKSKGMSSYEVVKRFEKAIKDGDDPSIAIEYGVQNGYDIEKLYNIAQRNVRGKMKQEVLR